MTTHSPYKPLIDGVNSFFYDVGSRNLIHIITKALEDHNRISRMANAATAHVSKYFTHKKLCLYTLETGFDINNNAKK